MRKKRFLMILFSLALIIAQLQVNTLAFTETDTTVDKCADRTELSSSQLRTTVSLTTEGTESEDVYDIVFVMDTSCSMNNVLKPGAMSYFPAQCEAFIESLAAKGVSAKVGVIKFSGTVKDAIKGTNSEYSGLTLLNTETKETIKAAFSYSWLYNGEGTNVHGGLQLANQWLEADTSTADDHKYVIFMTDGKANIWNSDDGVPTSIYAQCVYLKNPSGFLIMGENGLPSRGQTNVRGKCDGYIFNKNDSEAVSKVIRFGDFDALFASYNSELTGTTKYDTVVAYDNETKEYFILPSGMLNGTVTQHTIANAAEKTTISSTLGAYGIYYEYTPSAGNEEVHYLQSNQYEIEEDGSGNYNFTDELNENYFQFHVGSIEKSIYKAAHLYADMNDKYQTVCAVEDTGEYTNIVGLAKGFCSWLCDGSNSDYFASNTATTESTGKENVQAMMDAVLDSIPAGNRYAVASGTITDKIGDAYDLVLPESATESPFKLYYDDTNTPLAVTWNETDQRWDYGTDEGSGYPYAITLAADKRSFDVTIFKSMDKEKVLKVDFDLELKPAYRVNGTYPVNNSGAPAVLNYKDSQANDFQREYPIPQLTYHEGGGGGGGGGSTSYTLAYVLNGGTPQYSDESYSAGTVVSLTKTPEKENAVFLGWFSDQELTNQITKIKMDSNKTVYAGWKEKEPEPEPEPENPKMILDTTNHDAYMIGYDDGMFYPERSITRAETAAMIFRLLKLDAADLYLKTDCDFTDITKKTWYKTYVSTMSNAGIIEGYENNTFRPERSITRAEFTTMMDRFFVEEDTEADDENRFSDVSESFWARDAIARCTGRGLIEGYEDGTFRPSQSITRAEALTIMNRVLNRNPSSPEELLSEMICWPDNSDTAAWFYLDVQEASNSHEYERKEDETEKWTVLKSVYDWKQFE